MKRRASVLAVLLIALLPATGTQTSAAPHETPVHEYAAGAFWEGLIAQTALEQRSWQVPRRNAASGGTIVSSTRCDEHFSGKARDDCLAIMRRDLAQRATIMPAAQHASTATAGLGLAPPEADCRTLVTDGMLTNQAGMTLYTFDKDVAGRSACTGNCEKLWAPFRMSDLGNASGGSSAPAAMDYITDFATIQREDGTRQWAYKGKPLYLFAKDQKPGDRNGDDFNKVWHVAKP